MTKPQMPPLLTNHSNSNLYTDPIFENNSAMAQLMRSMDWAETALGAVEHWPENLRSALSICLNAHFPIAIYWGEALALLYNDAWRPIVGNKHPLSVGQPAHEVWPEIWDLIAPLFQQVLQTGEGTFSKDQLLPMYRHGYTEECYFDFTFSPIKNADGSVGGIFNAVQETTYRVIQERRSRLVGQMASVTALAKSTEQTCMLAMKALATDLEDIPFAILYFVNQKTQQVEHFFETGFPLSASSNRRLSESELTFW